MTVAILALAVAAAPLESPARAGETTEPYSEYQVKAAFLYHFTKYVEWPPGVFPAPDSSLTLCALGTDPFGGAVEEVIRDRKLDARPLVWRRLDEISGPTDCQVVFIGRPEGGRLKKALGRLRTMPILTVGETEEFGRALGIVWFTLEQGRVRFVINTDAAKRAGLTISSKLLAVAKVVTDRDLGAR